MPAISFTSQKTLLTNPPPRKLDGRLSHLFAWATQANYAHIWDLCCDHGRLGLHLHRCAKHKQSHIHLIDKVPAIIDALHAQCSHIAKDRLSICAMDASQIQLSPTKHLIILAGIGGKNAVQIIQTLLANHVLQNHVLANKKTDAHRSTSLKNTNTSSQQHAQKNIKKDDEPNLEIDLLVSPTNHIYTLRQYLHASPFYCVKEEFIHEKGQDYEHLFYRLKPQINAANPEPSTANNPAEQNPAGWCIWQPMTEQKKRYLNKIINHYQSCQSPSKAVSQAFKNYQAVLNAAVPPR